MRRWENDASFTITQRLSQRSKAQSVDRTLLRKYALLQQNTRRNQRVNIDDKELLTEKGRLYERAPPGSPGKENVLLTRSVDIIRLFSKCRNQCNSGQNNKSYNYETQTLKNVLRLLKQTKIKIHHKSRSLIVTLYRHLFAVDSPMSRVSRWQSTEQTQFKLSLYIRVTSSWATVNCHRFRPPNSVTEDWTLWKKCCACKQ